jgi:drug/metabolite transporter (DMT)-like permease
VRTVLPIVVAACAYALYHVAQKLTPPDANPFLTLAGSFAAATAGCLILFAASRHDPLSVELSKLGWSSPAVGAAVLAIETSFLIAYRQGWKIGLTSLAVTVAVTVLLIPIGRVFFGERLTWVALSGAGLSLAGLALVASQSALR